MEVPSVIILLLILPAMSLQKDQPKPLASTPCHDPPHSYPPKKSDENINKVFGRNFNEGKPQLENLENEFKEVKNQSAGKRVLKLPDKFYPEVDRDVVQSNDSDSSVGFSAMREQATPFLRALLDDMKDDATIELQSNSGRRGLLNGLVNSLVGSNSPVTHEVKTVADKARNGIKSVAEVILTFIIRIIVREIVRSIFGL